MSLLQCISNNGISTGGMWTYFIDFWCIFFLVTLSISIPNGVKIKRRVHLKASVSSAHHRLSHHIKSQPLIYLFLFLFFLLKEKSTEP